MEEAVSSVCFSGPLDLSQILSLKVLQFSGNVLYQILFWKVLQFLTKHVVATEQSIYLTSFFQPSFYPLLMTPLRPGACPTTECVNLLFSSRWLLTRLRGAGL